MTIIALRRGWKMIEILAHRGDTVMTARTSAQHLEVIDRDRRIPQVGRVTIFTNIGGADVIQALAGGRHTIVAIATTLGRDVLMIKVGR